jgi:hypothetical protein
MSNSQHAPAVNRPRTRGLARLLWTDQEHVGWPDSKLGANSSVSGALRVLTRNHSIGTPGILAMLYTPVVCTTPMSTPMIPACACALHSAWEARSAKVAWFGTTYKYSCLNIIIYSHQAPKKYWCSTLHLKF